MDQSNAALAEPQVDTTLVSGTTLCDGQFTVSHLIGAGGFGVTYKAEDNTLGRTVVIKECFPEDFCMRHSLDVVPRNQQHAAQFQSIVTMFMHEARSLAKLRHPNIVGVHRAFEENNTAYMVLDLIEGEDLLDIVNKKASTLTPDIVEDLLFKILDAVEKVHDMDLLHRDISPDNIMIDKTGTPILIDFGAARGDASRKTRLISSLLVVKDGYSPQEFYVAGSTQSPNSDLFALGATFYHLLTGQPPEHSQERMVAIAGGKDDPCAPLANRIKGYSEAFLNAIDQAMMIMPDDRLQSAAEWRNLLTGVTAPKPSKPKLAPATANQPRKANTADLGKSLTKLIQETNVEVSNVPTKVEAPVVVEAPKPVAEVPDWVAEFNRETVAEDEAPTVQSKPRPKRPKSVPPNRPTQAKTRIIDSATAAEDRPTGWALDAIQQRNVQAKSAPINVDAADATSQPSDIPADRSTDTDDGWLKPMVRMGLMGAFFGILVAIATTAVLNGGA